MSYMLLIVEPTDQRAERTLDEGQALYARMVDFAETLKARGVLRGVESLERSERGTRVQVRDGETRLLDGPFAEVEGDGRRLLPRRRRHPRGSDRDRAPVPGRAVVHGRGARGRPVLPVSAATRYLP